LKDALDWSATGALPLVGLLNRGARQGEWHLYTGLDMTRRLEIGESDILTFERLSPDKSPFGLLGDTRLLVRRDADITCVR